jgi:uncharacterized Zn-finger protein
MNAEKRSQQKVRARNNAVNRKPENCYNFFIENMKNHSYHHLPYKQFKCDTCDREFWTKGLLSAHQRNHKAELAYKCSFWGCDQAFERKVGK